MATLTKGTKVYLFTDSAIPLISGGEPTNQNDKLEGVENVQDYYGDLQQKQKDVLFQPSSLLGTLTGKKGVLNGTLYYNVLIKGVVDKRTDHGWKAGTYEKIDWLAWVSSSDITDSEDAALEKFDKRTDSATKELVKKANSTGLTDVNSVPKVDEKSNTPTLPIVTKQSTKKGLSTGVIIGIVAGVLILIIGGILLIGKKNKDATQAQFQQTGGSGYTMIGGQYPMVA
jgi:hypothetical protein